MEKKKLRISSPALQTLKEIGDYTEKEWGKKQSKRYNTKLSYRFKFLAQNPLLGRNCDNILPNLKSYLEGSHIIYYFVNDTYIEIADILHQNMDTELHFLKPGENQ